MTPVHACTPAYLPAPRPGWLTTACASDLAPSCSRFQPVVVPEPTIEEAYEILQGLRERYEAHHKLRYLVRSQRACHFLGGGGGRRPWRPGHSWFCSLRQQALGCPCFGGLC
jgi:hypothetical protein